MKRFVEVAVHKHGRTITQVYPARTVGTSTSLLRVGDFTCECGYRVCAGTGACAPPQPKVQPLLAFEGWSLHRSGQYNHGSGARVWPTSNGLWCWAPSLSEPCREPKRTRNEAMLAALYADVHSVTADLSDADFAALEEAMKRPGKLSLPAPYESAPAPGGNHQLLCSSTATDASGSGADTPRLRPGWRLAARPVDNVFAYGQSGWHIWFSDVREMWIVWDRDNQERYIGLTLWYAMIGAEFLIKEQEAR